jgi:branched-chain amino acid aminotransferase
MSAPLPFDDRDGWIWQDGTFLPWREARLHVLTHGLHYASAVFEGERVYNGKVFKLEEHNERLHRSAELLGFKVPYSVDRLNEITREVVKKNNLTDGYVRPIAWRGTETLSVAARNSTVHVAIAAWPWPSYFSKEARERGLKLMIAPWKRPSPETEPVHSKAAGLYMICTLSKHAAEDAGYEDALMLDWRGYVAEATGANVFFVMNGELHTPTPDCFLNGITRRTVIGLAKAQGINVIERHIKPEEMRNAQECFLTGSAAEVTPVGRIGDYSFTVGNLTKKLMQDYADLVRA